MTHVFYHPYKFPKFRNILAIKTSTASFKDTFSRGFDDHCRSFKIEALFLEIRNIEQIGQKKLEKPKR